MNQNELAKIAGVSESTVGKWVLKKSIPRAGAIEKISNHFNLPKSYLLKEETQSDVLKEATNVYRVSPETVEIPVLGTIACGDPILAESNIIEYRSEIKALLPRGDLFFLNAKGDSMHPTIPDGSLVLLREQKDVENGEIAAVMINGNEEATLKRIKKQGDVIMLVPENNKHDIIIASKENPIEIIGKAVEIRTRL